MNLTIPQQLLLSLLILGCVWLAIDFWEVGIDRKKIS